MAWLRCESGLNKPKLIGTYSGNKTIDISAYKRMADTVDNYIVEVTSMFIEANNNRPCEDTDNYTTKTSAITKTISGNNLIISGAYARTGNPDFVWGRCTLTYKVFHV